MHLHPCGAAQRQAALWRNITVNPQNGVCDIILANTVLHNITLANGVTSVIVFQKAFFGSFNSSFYSSKEPVLINLYLKHEGINSQLWKVSLTDWISPLHV